MFETRSELLLQLFRALDFAAEKHKKQCRKGKEEVPYINHPIKVAQTLIEVGKVEDPVVLIAALLHDTIEDTDTSEGEISAQFGKEVLSVVLEVTDNKSQGFKERKELQVQKAPKASHRAKCLKLADKICNVADILQSPPLWSTERKLDYINWSARVVAGLRGANAELEARFDQVKDEALASLNSESLK